MTYIVVIGVAHGETRVRLIAMAIEVGKRVGVESVAASPVTAAASRVSVHGVACREIIPGANEFYRGNRRVCFTAMIGKEGYVSNVASRLDGSGEAVSSAIGRFDHLRPNRHRRDGPQWDCFFKAMRQKGEQTGCTSCLLGAYWRADGDPLRVACRTVVSGMDGGVVHTSRQRVILHEPIGFACHCGRIGIQL